MAPKKNEAELAPSGDGEPHGLAHMQTFRDADFPDEKPDETTVANVETTPVVAHGPATEATVKAADADAASAAEKRTETTD